MVLPSKAAQIDSAVRIVTPENIAFRYQVAGPCRRLGAFLIDYLIRAVVIVPAFIVTQIMQNNLVTGVFFLLFFAVWWGYGAIFETYMNGQSPGKRMFRLRVLNINGEPINGMQAFIRNLLRDADLLPVVNGIIPTGIVALISMSLNSRYQRLGDLVAGTMVVVEERHWLTGVETLEDPRVYQLASHIPPSFTFSRSLSRTLAMYVERRRYFGPARRREIAQPLCEPLLAQFDLPPDTSYDLVLCALYYRAFVGDRSDDEQYAEVAARAMQVQAQQQQPTAPPLRELFPEPLNAGRNR